MSETFVPSRALDTANSPYQNFLTNGGFEQWNGGDVFVNPLDTQQLADGWVVRVIGVNTYTVSQESSVIDSGAYSMKVNITSVGSGTRLRIGQAYINTNIFVGKQVTISARVKSNIAGAVIMVTSSGGNTFSNAHTGDNTWQTLSVKTTISNVGLSIWIGFDSTAGTAAPANGIFYIDSAIVTFGTQTPVYQPEFFEIDLLKTGAATAVQQNLRNILVNGGFEQWQRGTSFVNPTVPPSAPYGPDKWYIARNGSGPDLATFAREASNVDSGSYSGSITITSAGGASTGDSFIQYIENYLAYRGKTLTLTCRIKTSLPNANISIADNVSNRVSANHPGDGNWHTLSVTYTINAAATLIYVGVGFYLGPGSTGVGYFDSAMLVVGSQPMPYVPEDAQAELTRCQRYYESRGSASLPERFYSYGANDGTNYVSCVPQPFSVTKSAIPTITHTIAWIGEDTTSTNQSGSYTVLDFNPSVDGFSLEAYKTIAGNRINRIDYYWTAAVT